MKKPTARQLTKIYESMRNRKNSKKVTAQEYATIRNLLDYGQKMSLIAVRSARSLQTIRRVKNSPTYADFLKEVRRWAKPKDAVVETAMKKVVRGKTPSLHEVMINRKEALDRITHRIASERESRDRILHDVQMRYLQGSMVHMHAVEEHLESSKAWSRLSVMALWGIFILLSMLVFKNV